MSTSQAKDVPEARSRPDLILSGNARAISPRGVSEPKYELTRVSAFDRQ
jgi:hypothetical protein